MVLRPNPRMALPACTMSGVSIANLPTCSPTIAPIGRIDPVTLPNEINISSILARATSILCAQVSLRISACSRAELVPVTSAVIARTASAFSRRYCAATIFSLPNDLAKKEARSVSLPIVLSLCRMISSPPAKPVLLMSIPSFVCIAINILRIAVPASAPFVLFCARISRAAAVSSRATPALCAAAPVTLKDSARSTTSEPPALDPAASTLTTRLASEAS